MTHDIILVVTVENCQAVYDVIYAIKVWYPPAPGRRRLLRAWETGGDSGEGKKRGEGRGKGMTEY